ncbi:MAG TPA: hypothetical protein VD836_12450, partial [Solirubrobacteraceae bacterium]|nr:hypothetical protein [Solirubrobacteraceae bacterium]
LRASEDLEAERDEAAREAVALHEELATLRDELAAASAGRDETGGLMARIAELEAAAGEDLGARAAQQTAASEAARADVPAGDLAARFDAAAAALRESAPAGSDEVSGAAEAAGAIDTAEAASGASGASAATGASAAGPAALVEPAPEPARAAPRIIDQAGHGARADVTGSSRREYPWLRGTVVKLAHDDPEAAARLLLGLVPAQSAVLSEPLEYDLTIREIGTHAISVAEGRASAAAIERPRMRSEAAFHVATDALSLAESLAGVPRRIGRWRGPVRVNGRRRGAETLRDLLTGADLSLAAAARAGAALDPDLVFRLFAYAIQPAWTKGHAFSVAQEVAGGRWLVTVADGAPVAVAAPREGQGADATVVMTRAAFDRLLRDEPAAAGELPVIRGDRAAVATLKAWTDRAQGR